MTRKLLGALKTQKRNTEQSKKLIYGSLGIPLDGQKLVDVPDRQAYVYVRLRDNQNEVIQAYNNTVAASYDLPVIAYREGNRYIIMGVNTQRYQSNWNNPAPYLPNHGTSHSFGPGGGGDVSWIYSRQMMPFLVYPNAATGTNVLVSPHYLLNSGGQWKYAGNTGTPDILGTYKPTGSNSVMILVYLDNITGNPGILIGSGSYFPNNITGTDTLYSYIPTPNTATQIPLSAVRLDTGTYSIGWNNLIDVRQWLQILPSGTSSGGGTFTDPFWTSGSNGNGIRSILGSNNTLSAGAFAVGSGNIASGTDSFARGSFNRALGSASTAEGAFTTAYGANSHAEGATTTAMGSNSHAEGANTFVSGTASHVEGASNVLVGTNSAIIGAASSSLRASQSAIVGGTGLTGTHNNMVYVPRLNVQSLMSGTAILNVGIDSNGYLVTGTTGGGSSPFSGVDQIGMYGLNQGVPLGTGTWLNVNGSRLVASLSGTVLQLSNSPDPQELIGIMGWDEGVPLGTGTVLNVIGNNIALSISGSVLQLAHTDTPYNPVDQIGIFGQNKGIPLGTGTVLNINGSRLVGTISGTVLNLSNSPDPMDNIGIMGQSAGTNLGTGTTLNVQSLNNTYFTISGSVLDLRISGSYVVLSNQSPIVYMSGTPTWTKPANLAYLIVEVVGGGGGGGGVGGTNASNAGSGGPGGGGGYAKKKIPAAALGSTVLVTVGSGGTGATAGTNDGNPGGTSGFGSFCSGTGGTQGIGQAATTTVLINGGPSGDGGNGFGGDINIGGSAGIPAIILSVVRVMAGQGGASFLGGSAFPSTVATTDEDGVAGKMYGGGATGGRSTSTAVDRAGGSGANGVVIIWEYVYT